MPIKSGYGFCFKGISSYDMGVVMVWMPNLPRASRRGAAISIPGRSGYVWMDDGGYGWCEIAVRCRTVMGASRDAISSWLSGAGELSFDMDEGYYYRARICGGFEYEFIRPQSADVEFEFVARAQPYRYLAGVQDIALFAGSMVSNPGNIESEPVITVFGEGDVTLLMGGAAVLINGMSGGIVIDCEAKTAYQHGAPHVPRTGSISLVSGNWPVMAVGATAVTWTGNVTKVIIDPQWRCG